MTNTSTPESVHHGRNIKRLREILGIKQETIAVGMGDDWSQKKVSRLEEKELIEDDILKDVARIMHVTPEAIKNFNEQAAINIIATTFTSHDNSTMHGVNYYPTFNPVDKVMELYERMLKEKNDMITKLESIINERK